MLSRSAYGVVPDAVSLAAMERTAAQVIYEKTISTFEDPPETATRLFEPQLEQEWPSYAAESAPSGAQTVDACVKEPGMGGIAPGCMRFGRATRIKHGRDFARVRLEGERLVTGCLIANWRRLPAGAPSRLGVITSVKVGGAVVRNRARRLLRESFRLHQYDLAQPLDLVLVARPSIAVKGFAEVEKDFLTGLRKAGLLRERGGK